MSGLELSNLTAVFDGRDVLGPISLTVAEGDRVALVGKSGAGKSTLLKLAFQHGARHAALVPQDLGLVQPLPVFHNVFMGRLDERSLWYNTATLFRPFRRDRQEIGDLLDQVAMGDKLWQPVAALSGGQRQRTAIARALYHRSRTLLADEPVSALDGPMAARVMELLRARFPTSLIALHDIDLALAYCNRIVGIQDGHIALDRRADELSESDLLALY
ncbi:MAG: ATP-binding cassette domain-containing protein [Pseudomonadales bacterium]|nr:ATP-binding cassette domain-containing protein [Pseudomonadales bacterium]